MLQQAQSFCTHLCGMRGGSEISPLLLSHFSRVRLCATPETAAHQAPPSLGFSRQEHWSGLPLPSPMHESTTNHPLKLESTFNKLRKDLHS